MPSQTSTARERAGAQVMEMQRRRLLAATVEVAFEHGVQALSVATICDRAGISRRTFYSLYEERDELLAAAFEDAVERCRQVVVDSCARERSWRKQMREGLLALLCFLDRDPAAGRLLVVEALAAGVPTLHARRLVLSEMVEAVDRGRDEGRGGGDASQLTAEGVIGAVLAIVHARMLDRDDEPLAELVNPLMAMVAQPYLGPAAARKELEEPVAIQATPARELPADPFKDLPMRLTYRTVRALSAIAAHPGSSNRQVGDTAGVSDVGQTSKLLHRLQRYGLIDDSGAGPTKGLPRAWSLTERGEGVLRAIGEA